YGYGPSDGRSWRAGHPWRQPHQPYRSATLPAPRGARRLALIGPRAAGVRGPQAPGYVGGAPGGGWEPSPRRLERPPGDRGEAGTRRPRRDAPPALMHVPTPTPLRRPTRPYLPEGHTRPQRHERLELAYRADAAVFARRASPSPTPRTPRA